MGKMKKKRKFFKFFSCLGNSPDDTTIEDVINGSSSPLPTQSSLPPTPSTVASCPHYMVRDCTSVLFQQITVYLVNILYNLTLVVY